MLAFIFVLNGKSFYVLIVHSKSTLLGGWFIMLFAHLFMFMPPKKMKGYVNHIPQILCFTFSFLEVHGVHFLQSLKTMQLLLILRFVIAILIFLLHFFIW